MILSRIRILHVELLRLSHFLSYKWNHFKVSYVEYFSATWKCSGVYEAGWELSDFDDSHWATPSDLGKYSPGWHGNGMDLRARMIWSNPITEHTYCRTSSRRAKTCNMKTKGINHFKASSTGLNGIAWVLTRELFSRSVAHCAKECARNSTFCLFEKRGDCEVPDAGCCGYRFGFQANICEFYTKIRSHNLTPISQSSNSKFYQIAP